MRIGKLDPKHIFDKTQEQEATPASENVVIGKLNTKNMFEEREVEKQVIKVGKINTQEMFTEQDTYFAKPCVVVGKLSIKVKDQ